MRNLRSLALLATALGALAPVATAQTGAFCLPTIQPFAANNGGSAGGAVYFDATVAGAIVVTDLVLNYGTASTGTTVGVDVYTTPNSHLGNEQNSGAWTLVGSGTGTMTARDSRTVLAMNSAIVFAPGSYGIALVATNGASHAYTNGNGTNQSYSDSFVTLSLGAASNAPWGTPTFTPRVVNMELCYNPGQGYARATRVGTGCGEGGPSSFYELFGAAPNDLSNTPGLRALWTGGTYVITPGASAIVPASGSPLTIRDDQTLQVPLPWTMPTQAGNITDVYICSNGWVSFEATTTTDLSESVADLMSGPTRIAAMWDDLNPAAGGALHAEQDQANAALFHITWDQVPEFGQSTPNTFQLTLDQFGGWELKFGALSLADGMVGYSRGNGSPDPGGTDISAIQSPIVLGDDRPALALGSVARPVIGQTATTRTDNIPVGALAGIHLYSTGPIPAPGLDLTVLGMPGCFLYQGGEGAVPFSTTASSATHNLNIPANSALVGLHVYSQSIVVAPGVNQLGVITSNGMDWLLDMQ